MGGLSHLVTQQLIQLKTSHIKTKEEIIVKEIYKTRCGESNCVLILRRLITSTALQNGIQKFPFSQNKTLYPCLTCLIIKTTPLSSLLDASSCL